MNNIRGFSTVDGGVVLTGDLIDSMCARCGQSDWPWNGCFMQGDVRASVAWPQIDGPSKGVDGCVAVAVLDAQGKMRVVTMASFTGVSTSVKTDGLGKMLADILGWGVRSIIMQADNPQTVNTWMDMLRKDSSLNYAGRQRGVPCVFNGDMQRAMMIRREMHDSIILPVEHGVQMAGDDAQGIIGPMMLCVAMLADSYKFSKQRRVQPEDLRWKKWE